MRPVLSIDVDRSVGEINAGKDATSAF